MVNAPKSETVIYVASSILRDKFNSSQIARDIESGVLRSEYLRDSHLEHPERVGEKLYTRGHMIRYIDADAIWVVEVFQYLRPDGSLGASGRQDPKRMRVGTEIWIVGENNATNP